jgi:hypothetical protein
MRDFAFYFGGFGASMGLLFFGLLIVSSPVRFLEFGKQVGKLLRMDPIQIELKPGLHWDWRLMGMVLALGGAFFLSKFVQAALFDLQR